MAVTGPLPRSRISREAAGRAVDSLLKWFRAQQKSKNSVGGVDEDAIYLILTLTRPPHNLHPKPYTIPLPHSLHDPSNVSLIVDDRPDSALTLSAARDIIHSLSLPVSQVLSVSDLRSGILPAGELLFAERRVSRLLHSFKNTKQRKMKRRVPVQIDFSRKSWPEYMRQVCFSTILNLGRSTCNTIRVGRASQAKDEIVDNVMAAVDGAVRNVPQKWSNVMSYHLKTSESLALPIYQKTSWVQKKVDNEEEEADDDDGDGGEFKRKKAFKGLEIVKHRNVEKRVENASRKRARA